MWSRGPVFAVKPSSSFVKYVSAFIIDWAKSFEQGSRLILPITLRIFYINIDGVYDSLLPVNRFTIVLLEKPVALTIVSWIILTTKSQS